MRARVYAVLSRLRDFVRPTTGEADFDQELAGHLAMAEEENVRRGMSPEEARRQARLAIGGVAQLREAARAARGLPVLETFLLDWRLGFRRLRKSWGLTLVGGMAMAITIGLGASIITIANTFAGTKLPLDDGERVVAIQLFDKASQEFRSAPIEDFRRWRNAVRSLEPIGAMRAITPRVITANGEAPPVRAAEMTASGFQLARVQPILGRPLLALDERAGAEPVAVIGAGLWRSTFSSSPRIIGQRIDVDDIPHVIVGVMPEGFRFPVNQQLWIPLQPDADRKSKAENGVFVFGRLSPGTTMEQARSEVGTLGMLPRPAGSQPASIEPRVVPYAAGFLPDVHANPWLKSVIFSLAALLLLPPCANIAILVYARTLTRRDEFAARTALGAGRTRIVMQVFVELLVLAVIAGFVGFLLARQFTGRLPSLFMPGVAAGNLPFWIDFTPSLVTILSIAALSVLAAAIAGGVPAFHVTGSWRRLGPSGLLNRDHKVHLGTTWTTLLAVQVALGMAILPASVQMLWGVFRPTITGPSLPFEQFLSASLATDGAASQFGTLSRDAVTQLQSEPGITGVARSTAPLMEEPGASIEVDERPGSNEQVRFNLIDNTFFDIFGARFLSGRRFEPTDFQTGSTAVIVNRSFIVEVLGEGNPLGRRVHYIGTDQTRQALPPPVTYQVVGVVEDFPGNNDGPMMFHPMITPVHPVSLTIRSSGGVGFAARRLRAVATRIAPGLRVGRLESLEDMFWERQSLMRTFGMILGSVTILVVLFSVAGIYTLSTFIVAQRWREIGVRAALGAQPRRLIIGIFGGAMKPLLGGAALGCLMAIGLNEVLPIAEAGGQSIPGIVPLAAALMVSAGLLAVAGPARRATRIDPTEALKVG